MAKMTAKKRNPNDSTVANVKRLRAEVRRLRCDTSDRLLVMRMEITALQTHVRALQVDALKARP